MEDNKKIYDNTIYDLLDTVIDEKTVLSELLSWLPNDKVREFTSDLIRLYDIDMDLVEELS